MSDIHRPGMTDPGYHAQQTVDKLSMISTQLETTNAILREIRDSLKEPPKEPKSRVPVAH